MSISPICIDASVVVRVVAAHQDMAVLSWWEQRMAEQRRIIAPALLFYEVTNALHRSWKLGVITEVGAREALHAALSLSIELLNEPDLHAKALAVAKEFGLPATYDAHYVALARERDAQLWTTDQRLVNRCRQDWVKLIE